MMSVQLTAEALRHNQSALPNFIQGKSRERGIESAPWFKVFKGDRINDHHLTRAEKIKAKGGPAC